MYHPEQREGSRAGTLQETYARCFAALNMTNYVLDNIYIIPQKYVPLFSPGYRQLTVTYC